jgi:Protein of unknwon function (DUF3310)
MSDPVNHPAHYTSHPSGIECIQVVEHMPYNIGAAIKYLWRCDLKDAPIQDLEKAVWYVSREIERRTQIDVADDGKIYERVAFTSMDTRTLKDAQKQLDESGCPIYIKTHDGRRFRLSKTEGVAVLEIEK